RTNTSPVGSLPPPGRARVLTASLLITHPSDESPLRMDCAPALRAPVPPGRRLDAFSHCDKIGGVFPRGFRLNSLIPCQPTRDFLPAAALAPGKKYPKKHAGCPLPGEDFADRETQSTDCLVDPWIAAIPTKPRSKPTFSTTASATLAWMRSGARFWAISR